MLNTKEASQQGQFFECWKDKKDVLMSPYVPVNEKSTLPLEHTEMWRDETLHAEVNADKTVFCDWWGIQKSTAQKTSEGRDLPGRPDNVDNGAKGKTPGLCYSVCCVFSKHWRPACLSCQAEWTSVPSCCGRPPPVRLICRYAHTPGWM